MAVFAVLLALSKETHGLPAPKEDSLAADTSYQIMGHRSIRDLSVINRQQWGSNETQPQETAVRDDDNSSLPSNPAHSNDTAAPKVTRLSFPTSEGSASEPESHVLKGSSRVGQGDVLVEENPELIHSDTGEADDDDDDVSYRATVTRQVILAVGCFFGGMLLTAIIGLVVYFQKRRKWKRQLDEVVRPKTCRKSLTPNNKVSIPYLQFRESLSDGGQAQRTLRNLKNNATLTSLLTSAATSDGKCAQKSPMASKRGQSVASPTSQTLPNTWSTYQGEDNPFINQFRGSVTAEGGEIACADSDVSVIVPPGAVPANHSQSIYVNVSL